jgi:hypothetical protein
MDIEEIKTIKKELEEKFSYLIKRYQEATNTFVTGLNFTPAVTSEIHDYDYPGGMTVIVKTPTVELEIKI